MQMEVRWVAAAWQHAQQQLAALTSRPEDDTGALPPPQQPLDAAKVTACLETLRAAAGAADHLAATQIPQAQQDLDGQQLPR